MGELKRSEKSYGRIVGATPAENKFYVLVMFDISDTKKYTVLTKLLKRYGYRIQNSIYEGYVKSSDYRDLVSKIDKIMGGKRFFNPDDRIRVYRISGSCNALIYGPQSDNDDLLETNLFL